MDFLDFVMNFMVLYIISNIISTLLIIIFSYATEAALLLSSYILSTWLACRVTNVSLKSATKEQRSKLVGAYVFISLTAYGLAEVILSIRR